MPDDRTTITELGTALGTLPFPDPATALAGRPEQLKLSEAEWDHLDAVQRAGRFAGELAMAFANGRALLQASDGLRDRIPLTIEWTGGRRPPGDEVAPIDLRIDHVYLISCKYESDILANASPGRLFNGLLATQGTWDRGDWYEAVAPTELAQLYRACLAAAGLQGFPSAPSACTRDQLAVLRTSLAGRSYPDTASRAAYVDLCRTVSEESARLWSEQLVTSGVGREAMLWRLLRIGSAPYFVLGHDRRTGEPARYRIASPWDWRAAFELEGFDVTAASAGQPRVDWTCTYRSRHDGRTGTVAGHVEIRWSHGRFAQPPEAKVYLDTPMSQLPGYHPLGPAEPAQPTLWATA
ncbi:MAG: hypothetical protein ABSC90_00730 [Acidimicrobiales bacterium]|jgi:hypothetical protein